MGAVQAGRVAVVVVNYGSSDLLADNLAPISEHDCVEVVIVDNLSTDAERAQVVRLADTRGWHVVTPSLNLGFGGGANLGVAEAVDRGAAVVCLLNPDASLTFPALMTMADLADQDRRAVIAPRIVTDDGRDWFTGARVDVAAGRTARAVLDADGSVEHGWLTGACLVFHAEAWSLTGGFDEDYFLYWEDVDLCWRHVAAGGRLRYLDGVTARHSVGGTQRGSRGRARSSLYYFYNCRNRLLFASKNLDRATQLRWALRSIGYAYEVLMRGGRRQFLRPWTPLSAATRGSCTGLARIGR